MSGYDWFITLVAIPLSALGLLGVALLMFTVWKNR